jgi:uncharacterized membrane protein
VSEPYNLKHIEPGRIISLTDAIFAIAMTVLVLTLDPPKLPHHPTEADVWNGVMQVMPNFLAFVASFVILGMYWLGHHAAFRYIQSMNRTLIWLNIYFLLFVSMVPYTTDLYAGDENSRIANTVFGANLIVLGLLSYSMWAYAIANGHVDNNLPRYLAGYITRRILTGPVLAAIGLLASLWEPVYAEYIFFGMVPVFMISGRIGEAIFPQDDLNNPAEPSS